MKRVFRVEVEEKGSLLIGEKHEFHVFAKDMTEAIKKVSGCISKKLEIVEAEISCDVDEDKDLKEYKEE